MIDHVDPVPFLIALALIVAAWLIIGIRARRRSRVEDAAFVEALVERGVEQGLCIHLWRGVEGWWVVCSRPYEHTGPHVCHATGDIDRGDMPEAHDPPACQAQVVDIFGEYHRCEAGPVRHSVHRDASGIEWVDR